MKPVDRDVAIKAAYLQRRAPQEWEEFIEALGKRSVAENEDLVVAHFSTLQISQGRAQAFFELAHRLREAPQVLLKIEQNGKNQ
jgi:hypothetical protein